MNDEPTRESTARTSVRVTRPGTRGAAQAPDPARLRDEFEPAEVVRGTKPGSPYVRLTWRSGKAFRRAGPGRLIATEELLQPKGAFGRRLAAIRRFLLGAPLSTSRLAHERLTKVKALAVFSSDAISSSAYATEEILIVLLLAGSTALHYSIPIGLAIACLLAIVVFSYRQTVHAYPHGGGSYSVAKENLGTYAGLTAAAALMMAYVLTVAVSIAAGAAAVISAAPGLEPYRVWLAVGFIIFMTLANLRGIRESGTIFAVPTYLFIVSFGAMIIVGIAKLALGDFEGADLGHSIQPPAIAATQGVSLLLILRAFSQGSAALTGTEAISNGVPAFKPDESRNAAATLAWMGATLGFFFLGVTFLAYRLGIVPSTDETVVSQIARNVFGTSFLYYLVQAATTLILILAANTAYADFPRLASILSRDGFMPHQFAFRGERLAFSNGIVTLGLLSIMLIVAFHGEAHNLIPLYALGVFLAFTFSQSGMVRRWWRLREAGWRRSMAINALGAITTALVVLVVLLTKFLEGAWVVLLLVAAIVWLFAKINEHYRHVARQMQVRDSDEPLPHPHIGKVIVPVGAVNRAVIRTMSFARSLSTDVTAVHIETDEEELARFRRDWDEFLPDQPVVIIDSPYRSFTEPLIAYLDAVDPRDADRPLTVVLPDFVTRHWWQWLLHNQTSLRLKAYLLFRPDTVVVDVPQRLLR